MARKKTDYNTPSATAVIYARYSSHAQRDVSIEQQVEECEAYARENNLEVIEIFSDRHQTGKTDKRQEFQRMMRHAERKQFQVIIAYKSNRMARNMLQALQYEEKLSRFGVRVVYAKEEFGDNAAGRFALRSMMNINQFFSENLSEDVKRGMLDNADNLTTNGRLPFGYKRGEDGKYAIDEPSAAVVREIFARVACGDPFVDIANDLNARGIKTNQGGKKIGGVWGKNSFHRMLSNERYIGIYIYGNVRTEGGVPQIIEKELFYKVQEILRTKKGPQGRHQINGDYLLTGKLYCGKCKSHMVGVSGTGKSGKLHYYYICQKKRVEKTCNKAAVRRDLIEREVSIAIQNYISQDDVTEWMADSVIAYAKKHREKPRIKMLEDQLAEVKKSTKNLLAAIEQGIITPTTKERLLELEAEQTRINARLAVEQSNILDVSKDDIISSLEAFRDGDVEDKDYQALLFRTFLIAVYLYDNTLKIVFNFTGKRHSIKIPLDLNIDNIENNADAECSYNFSYGLPRKKYRGFMLRYFLLLSE